MAKQQQTNIRIVKATPPKQQKQPVVQVIVQNLAQLFTNINGQMLHVKIGDDQNPATDEQITYHQQLLQKKLKEKGIKTVVFCTHHLVTIKPIK